MSTDKTSFPLSQPAPETPDTNPPKPGEQTGKQAMLFQPANAAVMAGAVGLGGWDGFNINSWGDWSRPAPSIYGQGQSPSPGLISQYSINGLPTAWPGQYTFYRRILNDPSVRFVRCLAYSPILAAPWTVKASKDAPGEAKEMIELMFNGLREQFLDDAVRGVDYGWASFEQIFELIDADKHGPRYAGAFWLKAMKPLLHDVTSIWVNTHGDVTGLSNNGENIDAAKMLLYTYDGESQNWYGRGRCQNLLEVVPWWRDANEGAARYDRKIAGVFMICHYPPGQSVDNNGKVTENWQIAQQMLDSVAAGKPIAVCNEFAGEVMDQYLQNQSAADRTRWKIELLEDKGSRQPGFGDRLAYLDRQKARAFLVPERSAFEAQKSGSRADSESHGDIILVQASIINNRLAALLNGSITNICSPINNILRMNWGPSAIGTVQLVPSAIEDDKKKYVRDLVKELALNTPGILSSTTDLMEMFQQTGLPAPSESTTSEQVNMKFDDMLAKQVQVKGKLPPQNLSREEEERQEAVLNRIRTYLHNGHQKEN